MTLPSSGSISLAQARDEFSLGNPVSLSQFYGKGSAPGSGAVSLSQLYGASAVTFVPGGNSASDTAVLPRHPSVTLSASVSGTWTFNLPPGTSTNRQNGYVGTQATFTGTSGSTASFSVTFVGGGVTKTWAVSLTQEDGVGGTE